VAFFKAVDFGYITVKIIENNTVIKPENYPGFYESLLILYFDRGDGQFFSDGIKDLGPIQSISKLNSV
jgi:hypothetical protein